MNKYGPIFDAFAYNTPPIRVDATQVNNLIQFQIFDNDTQSFDSSQFVVTTNDTNFFVSADLVNNIFYFNFKGFVLGLA